MLAIFIPVILKSVLPAIGGVVIGHITGWFHRKSKEPKPTNIDVGNVVTQNQPEK